MEEWESIWNPIRTCIQDKVEELYKVQMYIDYGDKSIDCHSSIKCTCTCLIMEWFMLNMSFILN